MVARAISMCVGYRKKLGRLTFVSHGSAGYFRIGKQVINEKYLTPSYQFTSQAREYPNTARVYPALLSLKPYFDRSGMVFVKACKCGNGDGVFRKLSALWDIPVVGWTGDITYGGYEGEKYEEGQMIVCISNMCSIDGAPHVSESR
jgi:hypothetical protein